MSKASLYGLISDARKGKRQAQNLLIELLWDKVFVYVQTRIKNENDAEDITIETFTKVLSKLKLYNEDFDFKTWVISIAHNTMIDHIRKKPELNVSMDDEDLFIEIPQKSPSPEERLIIKQDADELLNFISQLPGKYRNILELRYLEDKTYNEISEELNLSLSNVKVRLMRARRLLNELIE